ncbi:MAG: thioesterase domain-containing protein [Bacteroidales bacterium]|nr:thioesterase domain-containing protein [Bacteroidales bacterium]
MTGLESYLYEHIPITQAMGVRVQEAHRERVVLYAPLLANINHRETVFGGSASSLAILAGWSLLHLRLLSLEVTARLVIQSSHTDYLLPIQEDFHALSDPIDVDVWSRFVRLLQRRGRARIEVSSVLECQNQVVGRFTGRFVAIIIP